MVATDKYLPGRRDRAQHMRLDIAHMLKRFHFCERALIIAQAGWLAGIAPLDIKIALAQFLWEDAKTADEQRTRVFELRYPSRLLDVGDDKPVVELFEQSINAPSGLAFVLALARVLKPAQLTAYREYLDVADTIADGPSIRFMRLSLEEKAAQVAILERFSQNMLRHAEPATRDAAHAWVNALQSRLDTVGGLGIGTPVTAETPLDLPGHTPYTLAEDPARDDRFHLCRFYWPNIIDSDFPYGEGMMLQLRSAISHLNEVWAIETGGALLQAFADKLEWEFVVDAARWTYDEARHTQMGFERLSQWGFEPQELPLGTYIYESAKGKPPIYRLGMLHHFESKNIGKKHDRAEAFADLHDAVSQHDMEFDWADETIHAHYGSKWLNALFEQYPDEYPARKTIGAHCEAFVQAVIDSATEEELQDIKSITMAIIKKAEKVIAS